MVHTCARCGLDLSKIRAVIDPIYGLPLVTCTRCDRTCARRRPMMITAWRTVCRRTRAVSLLIAQMFAAFILMLGLSGASRLAVDEVRGLGQMPVGNAAGLFDRIEQIAYLVNWPMWCIFAGAWLTSALGHWRRRVLWPVFIVCLTLLTVEQGVVTGRLTGERIGPAYALARLPDNLLGIAMTLVLVAVGVPIGTGLRAMYRKGASQKFRRRRAKLRRRRTI